MNYKNKCNNSLEKLFLTRNSSLATRFLLAFQFLTIIPVKKIDNVSGKDVGGASAFFPVVGAVQGLLTVLSAIVFLKVFPVELSNGLVILVMTVINSGLHLDGLADTFDAIASRGGKEKKLAIMKDSTVGPFGVIAIVLVILLKYLSFNALFFNSSRVTYYSSLFLMPVFSRWLMVPAIFHGKSARQEGLGKMFIEHTGIKEMVSATFFTVLFSVIALFVMDNHVSHYALLITYYSLILAVLYIFCIIAVWFSNKNFGGMTGDTFGAVSEISEILFLIMAVICSQRFI
jgi:adenosylcobinamide-GDP ribazoletransferase